MNEDYSEDFVWCDVRWSDGAERPGWHFCADHKPGHDEHICCCGEREPE